MSKISNTTRALAASGIFAALMIAAVPSASAADAPDTRHLVEIVGHGAPGATCHRTEAGGSWSNDCKGVSGSCVGSWGSYGTYSEENGKKTYTETGSYADVYCV